jgi:phosphoglycolate phosphatase
MLSHLLLDLDGTLVDSSPGIFHSFDIACHSLGLLPPQYEDFCCLIGPPVQHIAKALYPDLDHTSLEAFRQVFRKDYDELSYRKADWYPGVTDTLRSLVDYPLLQVSVVTNKPTKPALELVGASDVYHCISRVVGIDYLAVDGCGPVFASKAEALSYVLSSTSSDPAQSLYVGDTPSDQAACCQCQLPFAAVLYGFHRWHAKERPPLYLERFSDLHSLIYVCAT